MKVDIKSRNLLKINNTDNLRQDSLTPIS